MANIFIGKEKNNQIVAGRYIKERYLGKGGFAYWVQVTDMNEENKYAMKVIQKVVDGKERSMEKINNEIGILSEMDHHNIAWMRRYFEDEDNVYIIMELCKNKSMIELLKVRRRLTEEETRWYIDQLVQGLQFIHSQNIVHRDLKLGNLFLTDKMELKIGDFGLSERIKHKGYRLKWMSGTPNYIAPEILLNKDGHSYPVDIWAIGVIAYTLLVGKPPFQSKNSKQTCSRIKKLDYSFPSSIHLSHDAKNFIKSLLQLNPTDRPTLDEVMNLDFMRGSYPSLCPASSMYVQPGSTELGVS